MRCIPTLQCSEKLDVDDHYYAWRQTHEQGAALDDAGRARADGPFSFCSFPWLLSPRAKSRLLHAEARLHMAQTVQQVCFEKPVHCYRKRHNLTNH